MKTLLAAGCAVACLALSHPASAALITFDATLTGTQETPPNASPATGAGTVVADTVAQTLGVSESFAMLSSPSTVSHLHFAPPGVAGPIILPLTNFPAGVTSGSFTGTFTAADLTNQATTGISTFAGLLAAMEAGETYLNIHSSLFPAGEIRGQLVPAAVPEPLPLALLLGMGLAGIAFARTGRSRCES
jgi:hypothetical protein